MDNEKKWHIINKLSEVMGAKIVMPSELLQKNEKELRCKNCGKLLAIATIEENSRNVVSIKCNKCKEINEIVLNANEEMYAASKDIDENGNEIPIETVKKSMEEEIKRRYGDYEIMRWNVVYSRLDFCNIVRCLFKIK